MSKKTGYTEEKIRTVLHQAADQNGVVRAEQFRATSKAVYQRLVQNEVDWRKIATDEGLQVASRVPRGHWSDPKNHIEAVRALAMALGHSPLREDYAKANPSANQRVDALFSGGFPALLEAAGLEPHKASGRADRWVYDDRLLRQELDQHADDGALPKASIIRQRDSSLEALVRARFGCWEAGAQAMGYEVDGARQQWNREKIKAMYLAAYERHGDLSLKELALVASHAFLRAVQREYGSIDNLHKELKMPPKNHKKAYRAPQGYTVDSQAELRTAIVLHALRIPSSRVTLELGDGKRMAPDFQIETHAGQDVYIEVLMVGEDDEPENERERAYQERWQEKKALYAAHDLPCVAIEPRDIRHSERLIEKLGDAARLTFSAAMVETARRKIGCYSPVVWTEQRIEGTVLAIGRQLGRMPTQSELRRYGPPGILNALYRRGYRLGVLAMKLGLAD